MSWLGIMGAALAKGRGAQAAGATQGIEYNDQRELQRDQMTTQAMLRRQALEEAAANQKWREGQADPAQVEARSHAQRAGELKADQEHPEARRATGSPPSWSEQSHIDSEQYHYNQLRAKVGKELNPKTGQIYTEQDARQDARLKAAQDYQNDALAKAFGAFQPGGTLNPYKNP